MADTKVTVRLGFRVGEAPDEASEEEVAAWFAAHPEARPGLLDEEGSIFMLTGGQEFRCTDQVLSLVSQVCFTSVTGILDHDEVLLELLNYDTVGRFRRERDDIEVASNVANPIRFPAQALLEALVDAGISRWPGSCGQRMRRK